MADDDAIDWSLCTFEGNRRRQHQEYLALPFRAKLEALEELERIAALFRRTTDDSRRTRPDG